MAQLKNTTVNDTGFLQLPAGTTAQRPGSPAASQMRFNSTTGKIEQYKSDLGDWLALNGKGVVATGGTVYDVDTEGTTYRVHVFTNTGNSSFTVTKGGEVEYLVVAGGGSAGGNQYHNGGGGAGGLLTGTTTVTPQSYTVTVGAGGAPGANAQRGNQGQNSSLFGLTAIGGGSGGNYFDRPGGAGGSGGGAGGRNGFDDSGGSSTAGQGNNGGNSNQNNAGGGGGAGEPGENGSDSGNFGGNGGIGLNINITGISTFFAGGGGAAGYSTERPGAGGLGGGGDGNNTTGNPGTPNTGGGGGAPERDSSTNLGAGGSGIVIIRYPLRQENPVSADGKVTGDGLMLDLDFAKPTVYSGSGTIVSDSRLNGISGTLFNSPSFKDPRTHRSSLQFSGASNNYAQINPSGSSSIIPATGDFTVEFIYQLTGTGGRGGIFQRNTSPTYYGFTFGQGGNGNWAASVQNTSGTSISASFTYPSTNTWYIDVAVFSGGNTMTIYRNGSLVTSTTGSTMGSLGTSNATPFLIANRDLTTGLPCIVGSVKVYNKALTASEIGQNFNTTRWRFGV